MIRKRSNNYFADTKRTDKLHGFRDTTIYVSYYGYWNMSVDFIRECKARNIEIWLD